MAPQGLDEHRTGKQCVVGGRLTGDASGRQVRRAVFASEQSAEVYAAAAIGRRPVPHRGCGRRLIRRGSVRPFRRAPTTHQRTSGCRVCDGLAGCSGRGYRARSAPTPPRPDVAPVLSRRAYRAPGRSGPRQSPAAAGADGNRPRRSQADRAGHRAPRFHHGHPHDVERSVRQRLDKLGQRARLLV